MDVSKLPRLSRTDRPVAGEQPPAEQQRPSPPMLPSFAAEAWISIAVGIILLLMQRNLVTWLLSRVGAGDPPAPFFNPQTGQYDIPYDQTHLFFHDLGLGFFALALIIEGVVLMSRRILLLWAGLGLMLLATVWNLATVVRFLPDYGLQIMPALAVAFGIYIVIRQWNLIHTVKQLTTANEKSSGRGENVRSSGGG